MNHTPPGDNPDARRSPGAPRVGRLLGAAGEYVGMLAVLGGMVLAFSLVTRHFFSATTFRFLANTIPDATVAAVGMTFVLMVRGIDLSVGSVLALSGSVLGIAMVKWHLPLAAAIPAALAVGLACGTVNGLVSVRWSVPPFIVTLGMLEVARGGTYLVTDSQTQYIGAAVEAVAEANVLGLPLPFLLAVGAVALGQFVLVRTAFGRHVVAVGSNEATARLCGVNVGRVRVIVFALCGLLASLAAVIRTSRMRSADPNAGNWFELEVIAAVVIGGTSLMGGRGSVVRSFFGVLIIAVLGAGLAQVGAREHTKRLITGCVIVVAVIIDHYRRRLGQRQQ